MDPKSFIQSGILEVYVLGQCTHEEAEEVERMVAAHPEIGAELAAIEQTLQQYATATAVAAPAWMKGRILERIDQEGSTTAPVRPAPEAIALPTPAPNALMLRLGLVGLAIAAAILAYLAWQSGEANHRLEYEKEQLQRQVDDCNQRHSEQNEEINRQRLEIASVRNPEYTPIRLTHPTDKTIPATLVFHRHSDKKLLLDMASVPSLTEPQRLQLWAIVDGKAKSLGMVDQLPQEGVWKIWDPEPNATAYAISIETKEETAPTRVMGMGAAGG